MVKSIVICAIWMVWRGLLSRRRITTLNFHTQRFVYFWSADRPTDRPMDGGWKFLGHYSLRMMMMMKMGFEGGLLLGEWAGA